MKKALLASSAVVLAMSMSTAKAAEWSMSVGGFYTVGMGLVNDNVDANQGVKLVNDGEIIFSPSITLDNGLKFGAKVEMEAQNGTVDESDAYVSGSFGEIRIGANDGAQDKFSGGIPCPTFTCTDDGYFDRTGASSIDVDGANAGDDIKLSYFTPSFAGFQAGVSYIPSDDDEGARLSGGTDSNSFEVGAAYANDFGGFSVAVGAGYYHNGQPTAAEESNFGVSASVGAAGFTVGGSFGSNNGGDDSAWGIGATYDTGPWNFGVHFADVIDTGGASSDEWNAGLGASYELAQGVTLGGTFEFGENNANDELVGGGLFLGLSF